MKIPGIVAGLLALPVLALAAEKPAYDAAAASMGASTYKTYCASCHGKTGIGDGPLASSLRYLPSDLTKIMKRNRGQFPTDKVARIIDGRVPVKGHGSSDMPIWGDAFLQSREGYDEAKVKERIAELSHFLASIQAEEPSK